MPQNPSKPCFLAPFKEKAGMSGIPDVCFSAQKYITGGVIKEFGRHLALSLCIVGTSPGGKIDRGKADGRSGFYVQIMAIEDSIVDNRLGFQDWWGVGVPLFLHIIDGVRGGVRAIEEERKI